jgi:hypothetical protein
VRAAASKPDHARPDACSGADYTARNRAATEIVRLSDEPPARISRAAPNRLRELVEPGVHGRAELLPAPHCVVVTGARLAQRVGTDDAIVHNRFRQTQPARPHERRDPETRSRRADLGASGIAVGDGSLCSDGQPAIEATSVPTSTKMKPNISISTRC